MFSAIITLATNLAISTKSQSINELCKFVATRTLVFQKSLGLYKPEAKELFKLVKNGDFTLGQFSSFVNFSLISTAIGLGGYFSGRGFGGAISLDRIDYSKADRHHGHGHGHH
eukprot:TRINITY_DN12_c0_g1_i1.p1 TRINITY_DN12_c0_g1~~TRINITY_DN12_c0_g1_i1.p1  ORF type:complete len:113 (+),score=50.83 TRINITY_DN12_c0_g1_i1:94-432(+)